MNIFLLLAMCSLEAILPIFKLNTQINGLILASFYTQQTKKQQQKLKKVHNLLISVYICTMGIIIKHSRDKDKRGKMLVNNQLKWMLLFLFVSIHTTLKFLFHALKLTSGVLISLMSCENH